MKTQNILLKPQITEKGIDRATKGIYTFQVDIHSTKNSIKKAVEEIFSVEVDSVRTVIRKGKVKRIGRRNVKKQKANSKIAYVTLKKGEITVFPKA